MEKEVFYYKFGKLNFWLFFNLLLTGLAGCCLIRWPCCIYWSRMQFLLGVIAVSFVLWFLMYVKKHRLAVIDEEGIKIDHCALLKWQDIEKAEDSTARCLLRKRKILILHPKEGIDYRYNPLQKLCMRSDFTAFSFPLYAMSREDENRIREMLDDRGVRIE